MVLGTSQGRRHRGGHGLPTFLRSKKKKGRQRQKRKGFKAQTIKRLPTMVVDNTFQVPWSPHFEIHFAGPASLYKDWSWSFMGLIRSELYCLGIRIQKKNFIAFIGREQIIYGLIT